MTEYVMDTFNVVETNSNVDEKWNKGKCLLISRGIIKHLHHAITLHGIICSLLSVKRKI